jgi:hypothetical protein
MATVNKNFRIKHGLVVEGTTGTINGQNILTETGSDQYILDLVGGANLIDSINTTQLQIVDGELSVKTGVFDASGAASTAESNANSYTDTALNDYTPTSALDTAVGGYGYLKTGDLPTMYSDSDVDAHISGGDGISYVSGALAVDLDQAGGLGFNQSTLGIDRTVVDSWYDASGAASTAQSNAETYADNLAANYDVAGAASSVASDLSDHISDTSTHGVTGDIVGTTDSQSLSNKTFMGQTNFQSSGGAGGTNNYVDVNNSTGKLTVRSGYALDLTSQGAVNIVSNGSDIVLDADGDVYLASVASGNQVATQSDIDTAINNLVDGAPGLLDTLNEIAAAINDDANYFTTISTAINDKQDALTASTGITIDGSNNISVTANTYDAYGAASTAESNANSYTDTAVGNIDSAVTQIDGASIAPNNVTINSVANQYAATITGIDIVDGASTVIGFSASTYRTVKALVKAKNGTHTQVSEILVTLDTSNNVAITEYAMVGTNGSLGDVNAIYHASGNIFITFTPVYDNTDVMAYATALI